MKKVKLFLTWALVFVVIFGGFNFFSMDEAKSISQPLYGGTFIMALSTDPTTMTPDLSTGWIAQQCGWPVYSSLINLDKDLNPIPNLAKSWKISKDKKEYIFYLRRGVKWQDGVPFTAQDVVFTFEKVVKKYTSFGMVQYKEWGLSVTAIDDYTVKFSFQKPFPALLTYLDLPYYGGAILPKHLWEGTDILKNPYNFHPVGTGPFIFKEYVKGDHITFVRNPNYFKKGLPYLDRIVLKIIPDSEARLLALKKGEIDCIIGVDFSMKDFAMLRKDPSINLTFGYDQAIGGIRHVAFNLRKGRVTANLKVRQAITMAVDKEKINKLVAMNEGKVIYGPASPALPLCDPNIPKIPYDPVKAEKLLDEAGYPRKADGVRFTLDFVCTTFPPEGKKVGEIIREDLKKVGIKVNVNFLEYGAARSLRVKGEFDMFMFLAMTGPDPSFTLTEQLSIESVEPAGYNIMYYHNPQVELLFKTAQSETDENKRLKSIYLLQELIAKDMPMLWLYATPQPNAVSKNFEGFNNGPWGHQDLEYTYWIKGRKMNIIVLQINNPYMYVNGVAKEVDPGRGTKPIIIKEWARTVVPIRAIVEALGGTIGWDGTERKVTINFKDTVIELWIDNPKAKVNGVEVWIDPNNHNVKPIIVNSRTMLPARFVAESLGCTVDWEAKTKTVTLKSP